MTQPAYDVAVVGAGFFGCRTALLLARQGLKVLLLEREGDVCLRASRHNQARVHGGYHYPRSRLTALGAARHYQRFCEDYRPLLREDFTHLYAIAAHHSKVTPYQFERFCAEIGAPLAEASRHERSLFEAQRIAAVYRVQEVALDTIGLGRMMAAAVATTAGVTLQLKTLITRLDVTSTAVTLLAADGQRFDARHVLLAGYGGMNRLLKAADLPLMPMKAELAVMPLVQRPAALEAYGLTVMDGPFFSMLPFTAGGDCTFSHVRYTPAGTVAYPDDHDLYARVEAIRAKAAACFPHIRNDAARYVPALREVSLSGLLCEVKVVPHKNELDDGRPILLQESVGRLGAAGPAVAAVLGSKLDSIYEWEAVLAARYGLDAPALHVA